MARFRILFSVNRLTSISVEKNKTPKVFDSPKHSNLFSKLKNFRRRYLKHNSPMPSSANFCFKTSWSHILIEPPITSPTFGIRTSTDSVTRSSSFYQELSILVFSKQYKDKKNIIFKNFFGLNQDKYITKKVRIRFLASRHVEGFDFMGKLVQHNYFTNLISHFTFRCLGDIVA